MLRRDDHTCQRCGAPATTVHHLWPVEKHPHLELEEDNCLSLCKRCHQAVHQHDAHPNAKQLAADRQAWADRKAALVAAAGR